MYGHRSSREELRSVLASRAQRALDAVAQIPEAQLLAENLDVLVASVAEPNCPGSIRPRWDEMTAGDAREATTAVRRMLDGRELTVPSLALDVHVPVDGPAELLRYQASSFTLSPMAGAVKGSGLELSFNDRNLSAPDVERRVEEWKASVNQHVEWVNNDLSAHKTTVYAQVRTAIEARKQRLLDAQQLRAALSIPMRPSPTERAMPVPMTRTSPPSVVRREGPDRVPEYLIEDARYEDILRVCQSWALAMERSPGTARRLDEESIRDLLLMVLNSTWEGRASAELFNGEGKTDILIRVDDRNVFIAEFKIWHGPKAASEAIDQLLRYLVWRDSKAALVMIIKNRDATAVLSKLDDAVRSHTSFILAKDSAHPERRSDYVLRAADGERTISLAVLPVVLLPDRDAS
jgi:hypothetical protein